MRARISHYSLMQQRRLFVNLVGNRQIFCLKSLSLIHFARDCLEVEILFIHVYVNYKKRRGVTSKGSDRFPRDSHRWRRCALVDSVLQTCRWQKNASWSYSLVPQEWTLAFETSLSKRWNTFLLQEAESLLIHFLASLSNHDEDKDKNITTWKI